MTSTYQLILSLDHSTIDSLLSKGLFRPYIKKYIAIYEYYTEQCSITGSKMQARTNTAEQFRMSEETVSRVIQKLR